MPEPLKPDSHFAIARLQFQDRAVAHQSWSTCLNCEHWSQWMHKSNKHEECDKYKMRPPAAIIVTGCPEWEGGIPF